MLPTPSTNPSKKRKREIGPGQNTEASGLGGQALPVAASLPPDGVPTDGAEYLYSVRLGASLLPFSSRAENPYIPADSPKPPKIEVGRHPALPSDEWKTLFSTRFINFRENLGKAQISPQTQQAAREIRIPAPKDRPAWQKLIQDTSTTLSILGSSSTDNPSVPQPLKTEGNPQTSTQIIVDSDEDDVPGASTVIPAVLITGFTDEQANSGHDDEDAHLYYDAPTPGGATPPHPSQDHDTNMHIEPPPPTLPTTPNAKSVNGNRRGETPHGGSSPIAKSPQKDLEQSEVIDMPSIAFMRRLNQEIINHVLMHYYYWLAARLDANPIPPPETPHPNSEFEIALGPTDARWLFSLLAHLEKDMIFAKEVSLLRNLARVCITLVRRSLDFEESERGVVKTEREKERVKARGACWMVVVAIVSVWGQNDIWAEGNARLHGSFDHNDSVEPSEFLL